MILSNFKDFPKSGRILGLDWGAVRTGVAISDIKSGFVFPRPRIESNNPIDKVLDVIKDERAVGIIIGLPIRADGTESKTSELVRLFAGNLSEKTDLPIAFIPENLTSVAAEEFLACMPRATIKQNIDSRSAVVILENAIAMISRI